MTAPVRLDWSVPYSQAMAHLRMRICGQRYRDYKTPQQRVKSGLYAIGYAGDGSPHAVRVVPVIQAEREILDAVTSYAQVFETQVRIAATWRQAALCEAEVHLDGGLIAARPWIPLPDSCKGCVAKC